MLGTWTSDLRLIEEDCWDREFMPTILAILSDDVSSAMEAPTPSPSPCMGNDRASRLRRVSVSGEGSRD